MRPLIVLALSLILFLGSFLPPAFALVMMGLNPSTVLGPTVITSGISLGYMAGITGARFEFYMSPFSNDIRFGGAYAEGKDSESVTRKHTLIFLDMIYQLPESDAYCGIGANYDAYTSGRASGSLGGEVFLGQEAGSDKEGKLFLEIGYGAIRTGFSPDYSGLTAMVGFKF
jgi:hypothetical protein